MIIILLIVLLLEISTFFNVDAYGGEKNVKKLHTIRPSRLKTDRLAELHNYLDERKNAFLPMI
ncbi:MAG: hypothetical protein NVSMB45_12120 [Ginsengibacter sp.]